MKRIGLILSEIREEDKKEIPCPHCGKEYKSEKTLAAHCRKEHPDAFHDE